MTPRRSNWVFFHVPSSVALARRQWERSRHALERVGRGKLPPTAFHRRVALETPSMHLVYNVPTFEASTLTAWARYRATVDPSHHLVWRQRWIRSVVGKPSIAVSTCT